MRRRGEMTLIVLLATVVLAVWLSQKAIGGSAEGLPLALADSELIQFRGGQSQGKWCRDFFPCNDPPETDCPGGQCGGDLRAGDVCYALITDHHPEECTPNMGNETCSSNPPTINVLCSESFDCKCKDVDNVLMCIEKDPTDVDCENIQTEIYCHYPPCPL